MSYHDKEIIKKIEEKFSEEKSTVLSSSRSTFLNQGRLSLSSGCLYDIVVAVDISGSVGYSTNSSLSQAQNDFISSLITDLTPQMVAGNLQLGICKWGSNFSFVQGTSPNKWLSNDPIELDALAQSITGNGGTHYDMGLNGGHELLNKAQTDPGNCSLGNRAGQPNFRRILIFMTDSGPSPAYWGNFVGLGIQATAQSMWPTEDIYCVLTHPGTIPPTPTQEHNWRTALQPMAGTIGILPGGDYNYTAAGTVASLNTVSATISSSICNPAAEECYAIGDTGPEGGTIFAVPLGHPQNNGVNQTNFYYEVAKNDIAIGGTPNAGFNISCGDTATTTTSQSLQNMAVGGTSISGFGTYSINIGDEITSLTPGLFPLGTTVASIIPGGPAGSIHFTASNPANFTGNYTIILTTTSPPIPWSVSGAEWGVHNKLNIATSTDFGTGHKNTDAIDIYPLSPGNPTGGIHPWLDAHDIAATICKQHPSAKDDWFLPSRDEFVEMVDASNTYSFPLNLNTLGQNSEHQYWTSSQYRHDPTLGSPPQFPDKYSWAVKSNGAPGLAYRCHALSVRPIRRFECEPEIPCIGCGCIEYNWRDYAWGVISGGGLVGHLGQGSSPIPNQPNEFDSWMGGDDIIISMGSTDVMGNEWTLADWQDDSIGYTITLWDRWYNYLGKWKYNNFVIGVTETHVFPVPHPLLPDKLRFGLTGVTHLDGPSPFINYNIGPNGQTLGSATKAFFKIEAACNTNLSTAFENGCNHLYGQNDSPAVCLNENPPAGYIGPQCTDSFGTYTPPSYYQYFTDCSTSSCGCNYNIGDTGPGGGIIVATPWMNINSPSDGCVGPITPALQGVPLKNPTDYYYEISPENLNTSTDAIVFGSAGVGMLGTNLNLNTDYVTPDANVIYCPPLNPVPGQVIPNNEYIGQGEQATQDIMNTTGGNPTVSFPLVGNPTVRNAFEACSNYQSNGYTDWFLPTTHEMEFARNYSPPGTLYDSLPSGFTGSLIPIGYWTCNAPISTTSQLSRIDYVQGAGLGDNEAFGVSGNSFNTNSGPYGYNWRTSLNRRYPLNVRAMRKFKCSNNSNPPIANNKRSIPIQENRKSEEVGPFGVNGYYPLYGTIEGATKASPESSYHIHEFEGFEYYMPEGLKMGETQFHGNWDPKMERANLIILSSGEK